MKKINGFIWVETLVSLNIVILIASTIIPLHTSIKQEKKALHDRAIVSMQLYDELQTLLFENNSYTHSNSSKIISGKNVNISFTNEFEFLKGCASWENVKKREEQLCLYGLVR